MTSLSSWRKGLARRGRSSTEPGCHLTVEPPTKRKEDPRCRDIPRAPSARSASRQAGRLSWTQRRDSRRRAQRDSLPWLAGAGDRDGFDGLLHPEQSRWLSLDDVRDILPRGGTILGTTNRGNPFLIRGTRRQTRCGGSVGSRHRKRSRAGSDALVVVGGDGTQRIGLRLHERACRSWVCPRPSTTIWRRPIAPLALTVRCTLPAKPSTACTPPLSRTAASCC